MLVLRRVKPPLKNKKMKKTIYLASWLVLTGTDAILGYKTAVSDFGITDTSLAIIWALGFSLLSVPLKVIYDRTIETGYRIGGIYGNLVFLTFSAIWIFVCFNAYTGISELRKRDMQRLQINNFESVTLKKDANISPKIENTFDYKLARKRLILQGKQDSLILALILEQKKEANIQRKKLMEESNGNGFLYFNLLLILSASVCLSLGLEDENTKLLKIDSKELKNNEPIQYLSSPEIVEKTQEKRQKTNDLIVQLQYRCDCCNKTFINRWAYNGHFKGSTCEKGKFTKIEL
jgi:hypothetical protein